MILRFAPVTLALSFCGVGSAADGYFSDLTEAAIRGDAEEVQAILDWGADPNRVEWLGLSPLSAAMRSCFVTPEVVYVLLKAGADIEATSAIGATPLMLAWQMGREDLAEMLLALGADPLARNIYGDTARDYELFFSGELPESEFATWRYTSLGSVPRSAGGSMKCTTPEPPGD